MIGVLSVIGGTAVVRDLEGDGAYPLPLALAAGAKTRSPISATAMTSPLLTAFPSGASGGCGGDGDGLEGIAVSIRETEVGASKVCEASSRMVMVLSVPAGASFTGVTLKVMVLAD